jgi:zinc protease
MNTDPHLFSGSVEPSEIPSIPAGVRITTLENGLTIIVREDHSAPVVAAQAWCRAGSIHEGKWIGAGLSHVLEHMLFKGTTTRGPGRIDQEVQDAGGEMNAYTSFDRTVYHITVPNTGARVAIDILCDIMQNATLPPEELAKEMDVIRREMDMNQDDPGRRSGRRLFETAYTQSSYRLTVIGYPDIFNELKPEDIRNYYHEKYAPNNVFFVVVGDLKADDAIAQIRECFSKSRARAVPPVFLPAEPIQTASREVTEYAAIELGHIHVSWHIPEVRHPDVPALDVLANLLGTGRSSRLYQQLREKKGLVSSIDAWTYSPGNPGLLGVSAVCECEKFSDTRAAIFEEIERLKSAEIATEELAKAQKQFLNYTLASRKTMQGQAQDLGANWIAASDLNFSERYLAAVRRLTPADLRRVAVQYLRPENRTLYALQPNEAARSSVEVSDSRQDHAIKLFDLPNGLQVLLKEDHRLPFVEFRAVFRGGVFADTKSTSGACHLMSRLMLKGTKTRSAEQIAREIESLGGSLDTYGGNNSFGVSAEVLSSDFQKGLALVSDVILDPIFPDEAFAREKEVQASQIRSQRDHLLSCAFKLMKQKLFGDEGYGLDALGTEDAIKNLQRETIRAMHSDLTVPHNCVLAIFGDIDPARTRAAIEAAFSAWRCNPKSVGQMRDTMRTLREQPRHTDGARVSERRDKKQAVLVCGFPTTTMFDRDHYALELLEAACSDMGSRLFLRVRENLGLAYYVGAQNFSGLTSGYFSFYAGTDPEKAERVESEFIAEVQALAETGLTDVEITRAKAKIIGQKKIARQDLGGSASTAALDQLNGLGYVNSDAEGAIYEALTEEQILGAIRRFLNPSHSVKALISP